jgi:NTE family protein
MKVKSSKAVESAHKEGVALLARQEYQAALVKFNSALKLEATHPESLAGKLNALCRLAITAQLQGEEEVALTYWQHAHDIDQYDSVVIDKLAKLRHKMNQDSHPQLPFELPELSYAIDRLVFQGGGIKGIAYLGAIEVLFSRFVDRAKIKATCGSSAGGIMAFLIALGFSHAEMTQELQSLQFTDLMDSDYRDKLLYLMENKDQLKLAAKGIAADLARVGKFKHAPSGAVSAASNLVKTTATPDMKLLMKALNLLNKEQFGLFPGNYIRERVFERMIQQQTGIPYCTFAELHQLHLQNPEKYKDLYLTGANISREQVEIFSHEATPNDIISDAMRITVSIPGFYEWHSRHVKVNGSRVKFSEDVYVDGGLTEKYPLWVFDRVKYLPQGDQTSEEIIQNPHTLGFRLVDSDKVEAYTMGSEVKPSQKPTDGISYFWKIFSTINHKQEADHRKNQEAYRTIYIDHMGIPAVQFDLNPVKQQALIAKGREATTTQFSSLNYELRTNEVPMDVWQAIATNKIDRLEMWLRGGFKLSAKNAMEQTVLDIAFENRRIPMLVFLVSHGALQTRYAPEIRAILHPLLNNEAIDIDRLERSLRVFEQFNGLGVINDDPTVRMTL